MASKWLWWSLVLLENLISYLISLDCSELLKEHEGHNGKGLRKKILVKLRKDKEETPKRPATLKRLRTGQPWADWRQEGKW